jgi:hypothetical protein
MPILTPIFAIHKRGKLRSKNNPFRQVLSMEKGTFADSGKMA